MVIVSSLLNLVAYPTLANLGYFRRRGRRRRGLSVLTYHGVLPRGYRSLDRVLDGNLVSAETFRRQLTLLKQHYSVIAPEQLPSVLDNIDDLPANAVLLTCDDALTNVATEMLPVLQELDLKCLFFFTGAALDDTARLLWYEELWLLLRTANPGPIRFENAIVSLDRIPEAVPQRHERWWRLVLQLSRHPLPVREAFLRGLAAAADLPESWKSEYLTEPGLRARFALLPRAGLVDLMNAGMTLGAHTLSHPVLAQCPDALAREEIAASAVMADDAFAGRIWALAYPFGTSETVSRRDVSLASESSYRCAFLNAGGRIDKTSHLYSLPRIHVSADLGLGAFEAHVSGFHWNLRARLRT